MNRRECYFLANHTTEHNKLNIAAFPLTPYQEDMQKNNFLFSVLITLIFCLTGHNLNTHENTIYNILLDFNVYIKTNNSKKNICFAATFLYSFYTIDITMCVSSGYEIQNVLKPKNFHIIDTHISKAFH